MSTQTNTHSFHTRLLDWHVISYIVEATFSFYKIVDNGITTTVKTKLSSSNTTLDFSIVKRSK